MKGTLVKTGQGWVVSRCVGDGVAEVWEERLPLHPDDAEQINKDSQVFDNIEARIASNPEVEFEIGRYCKIHNSDPSKNSVCTLDCGYDELFYAKLINHSVEPNEMIDHIGDANKMVEDDVWNVGLGDELNKLPYTKHLDDGQYNDGVLVGYELGATWGYNKAKETLYTKEQVQKMIDDALINYEIGWADRKKQFSLYEHKETITSADTPVSKTFLESIPKQETLYTEEQVRDIVLKFAEERTFLRKGIAILWIKNYFKSLKQPKQ